MGKIANSYLFQQKIDVELLGYTPNNTGITADNSTGTISYGGATWNKKGCVKWSVSAGGNDHTYCAYTASSDRTWAQAYNFAQNRGGYLVTITSDTERNWITTNIITAKSLATNIWLGYNKFQSRYIPLDGNNNDTPFNRYRYKWITGEQWAVNWEVAGGATVQQNFDTGMPSIVSANGAAYIMSTGTRKWADRDGVTATNAKDVIVEFQDAY